jgi:hypothetical protein
MFRASIDASGLKVLANVLARHSSGLANTKEKNMLRICLGIASGVGLVMMAPIPTLAWDPNYNGLPLSNQSTSSSYGQPNDSVRISPSPYGGYDMSNGVSIRPSPYGGYDATNGVRCRPNGFGGMDCTR